MTKSKKIFTAILAFLAAMCLAFGISAVGTAQVKADTATVLTDKDTFVSAIKADPSGNYELGGDIDFGGDTLSESIDFSGTLDGKGYHLKNFKLGISEASGWCSRFINENTGTIKNIGLEIVSIQANNNEFGFINTNKGSVSNVYVDFNFDSTQTINQWCHYGTIAMKNDGGTIENCVVNITVADGVDIGVGQGENGNIFAAICAYNVNGGVLNNCHAIIGDNNIGVAIFPWATQTDCNTYATMAELASAISFDEANGWNTQIWEVENGEVVMRHYEAPAEAKVLTQADVANFKTLLNGSTGSFVLGEDLDFENAQTAGVIDFGGTLDGNGYSLKNLLIHYDARDDGWASYLFSKNSGTIKNLGVYYTLNANSSHDSFIYKNEGTVSNVFVETTFNGNDAWVLGTIVNENNGGTIENCVVVLNSASTGTAQLGSIVGVDRASTIKNCYAVTNGKISSETPYASRDKDGEVSNCANYETMAELAAALKLEEANGWNADCWENTGSKIVFGKKVAVEMEIIGASVRYATASDKNSGIRFGVKLNLAAYEKYAAIEGSEMGMVIVPESASAGVTVITLETVNAQTAITFGADGNKWGYYKENGAVVEGYVQSVVYVWGIPTDHYNDDIKVAAYIKADEEVFYSDTLAICIDEVAFKALETETDSTKIEQLNAYLTANEYTVEFKDGDSVISTKKYHYGDTATEPDTAKAGYTFLGWDKDFVSKVTKDVTYTARYEEKITVLTQADVDNFKTLLNGSSEKFVLGEDLDFQNAQTAGVIDFSGILDGNGYSLKNLLIQYDARDDGWESYLFSSNKGTIKNLGVYYTLKANGSHSSFIYKNQGTVSNLFVKATVEGNDGWTLGTIVNENDGGTVENCVVVLDSASTGTAQLGSIVGVERLSIIKNCYAVTNGKISSKTPYVVRDGDGAVSDCANYATIEELAAAIEFTEENGWNQAYVGTLFAEIIAIQNSSNEITSLAVLSRGEASCEDDRIYDFAAEDLQYYFQLITGKTLTVKTVSNLTELESGKKYFILGGEFAEAVSLSFSELTTETGYIIHKTENGVFLYGNTAYGTLNAVYALLNQAFGLEIYTDTVYTYDRDGFEYSRVAAHTAFNPSIDKLWAQDGSLTYGTDTQPVNFTYQRRLGFVNSWQEVNGTYHNFLEVVPKDTYGAAHPAWFVTATATDTKQSFDTLCLASGGDEMAEIVAKYARDFILSQDSTGNVKDIFVFGQPDRRGWCSCSASESLKSKYGANSAEYILFMNKVAKIFDEKYSAEVGRKITFMIMAYNLALEAPTANFEDVKLYNTDNAEVAAMVAMIEGNSYRKLEDDVLSNKYGNSNRYFLNQYNTWQGLGKAYFWRYSAYFDNYFVPLDTISNMQDTYKTLAESGATVLVDQGMSGTDTETNFNALKIYLKSKLAKNVNADLETLIRNFCNAYYGAGGEKMYEFLTVYRAWYATLDGKTTSGSKDKLGCHIISGMDIFQKKYWDDTPSGVIVKSYDASMLKGWYANYIEAALGAVDANSDYAKRIKIEGLSIRYMAFAVYGDSTYGDFSAIASDAAALGVTRFAEGNAYTKSGSYVSGEIANLG